MIKSITGENLYSIGEVARTLGISTQAIRYYDRKGIIKPKYINPQTGYRYYNWQQFRILNNIKYMQSLGFKLHDIDFIIKKVTCQTNFHPSSPKDGTYLFLIP